LFSGFTKVSTVPAGSLAKASLVGAKTVKGPGPESAPARSAAVTAATSVVCTGEATAFSTMFLSAICALAKDVKDNKDVATSIARSEDVKVMI
jgi:hypothetical protein